VAEFGVKYDIAALVPIIHEAGGRFTDIDGADSLSSRSSLATNGRLHDDFLSSSALRPPPP
jgi:histidinol-phosphatase